MPKISFPKGNFCRIKGKIYIFLSTMRGKIYIERGGDVGKHSEVGNAGKKGDTRRRYLCGSILGGIARKLWLLAVDEDPSNDSNAPVGKGESLGGYIHKP